MTELPVSDPWYIARKLDDRITLITEPHVHPIFSANMHLVEGSERDLLIDSGMGVAPLREFVDGLRAVPAKPLVCLSTHTHVDHIGAVHEFEERLVHPLEAGELEDPTPYTLHSSDIPADLAGVFRDLGYEALWPLLIDAVPWSGYDPASYRLHGAKPTGLVEDGDVIDLGDWQAEILHLPGHSPGQVGLWHGASGTLFGADAIYDGPLVWTEASDMAAYAETLRRIKSLPISTVHGGHDPAFGPERARQICDAYLNRWQEAGLI